MLAAAAIRGEPIAAVARGQRISRSWASRETNAPQTRLLIAELLDAHRAKVKSLVPKALRVIEQAFAAMDGARADHRVRLLAAKRVIELALAGRRPPEPSEQGGTFTWESFERFYLSKKGEDGSE